MAQHKQHQLRQSHPTYLFFRSILCSTPFLTNCCLLPQKFSFLARLQSSMIKRLVIPMIQVPMSLLPTSTMTSSIPWTKFSTATRSFSNIFSRLISLLIRLPSALAILFRWAPVLKLSRNFSIQFNPFIPYLVIPLTWTVFGFRFLGRPSPSTPGGSLFRAISTLTKFSLCYNTAGIFPSSNPPIPKMPSATWCLPPLLRRMWTHTSKPNSLTELSSDLLTLFLAHVEENCHRNLINIVSTTSVFLDFS